MPVFEYRSGNYHKPNLRTFFSFAYSWILRHGKISKCQRKHRGSLTAASSENGEREETPVELEREEEKGIDSRFQKRSPSWDSMGPGAQGLRPALDYGRAECRRGSNGKYHE
jgi:hypothetical protein